MYFKRCILGFLSLASLILGGDVPALSRRRIVPPVPVSLAIAYQVQQGQIGTPVAFQRYLIGDWLDPSNGLVKVAGGIDAVAEPLTYSLLGIARVLEDEVGSCAMNAANSVLQSLRQCANDNNFYAVDASRITATMPNVDSLGGMDIGSDSGSSNLGLDGLFDEEAYWRIGGNDGLSGDSATIGTNGAVSLTMVVHGQAGLRLLPSPLGPMAPNFIGGSWTNAVDAGASSATIGGGRFNSTGNLGTVGGGGFNAVKGPGDTVGGGYRNTASSPSGFACCDGATVSGGSFNTASAYNSTVAGGRNNVASWGGATVIGGEDNTASGGGATVLGGAGNVAQGANSLAAGFQARALHNGSFVWSDGVPGGAGSTAQDQFIVSAHGGVGVGTNTPDHALSVSTDNFSKLNAAQIAKFKNASRLSDRSAHVDIENGNDFPSTWRFGVGGEGNDLSLTTGQFYLEHSGAIGRSGPAIVIDPQRNFTFIPQSGSCTLTNGGVGWACSSDRALKENFAPVDGRDVLAQLAAMPITKWNVKGASATHLGAVAQDFYSTFRLGDDDQHINTVDAQGVALASIQGLYQIVEEKDARIAQLESRLAQLEAKAPNDSKSELLVYISLLCLAVCTVTLGAVLLRQRRT